MADAPRLAVSNIAWDPAEDDAVAAVLRREGVHGIEIAPTKWREDPTRATSAEIAAYRRAWSDRGLEIASCQALLFGRPDLQLFGDTRPALAEYLRRIVDVCTELGARAFVFGSPKNRVRGTLPAADARRIAGDFFRPLGAHAAERGAVVCIEPNPAAYGCDFVTTTAEAMDLVTAIAHPGIAVNADLGAMTMNGESPSETLASLAGCVGHFHASEPNLAELGAASDHASAAAGLTAIGYDRWLSIEMRGGGDNVARVERAVRLAKRTY